MQATTRSTTHSSPLIHQRQTSDWDCGVACLYPLLVYFGSPSLTYRSLLTHLLPCQQRIWTLDLAVAAHACNCRLRFCTRVVGVECATHVHQSFYDHLEEDRRRITRAAHIAHDTFGIDMQQTSVSSEEIKRLITEQKHFIIALVDQRYINCSQCQHNKSGKQKQQETATNSAAADADNSSAAVASSSSSSAASSSSSPSSSSSVAATHSSADFVGHFLLCYDYSPSTDSVFYLNPACRFSPCCMSLSRFDSARLSCGTDEDIIVFPREENMGRANKFIHQLAIGSQEDEQHTEEDKQTHTSNPSEINGTEESVGTQSHHSSLVKQSGRAPSSRSAARASSSSSSSAPSFSSSVSASAAAASSSSSCAMDTSSDIVAPRRSSRLASKPFVSSTPHTASSSDTIDDQSHSSSQHTASAHTAAAATAAIRILPASLTAKCTGLSRSAHTLLLRKQSRLLATHAANLLTFPSSLRPAFAASLLFAQSEAGSAVCIDGFEGLILTCAHCIGENEREFAANRNQWLLFTSGRIVQTECIQWDPKRDLALLKICAMQQNNNSADSSTAAAAAETTAALSSLSPPPSSPSPSFPFVSLSLHSPSLSCPLYCIGQPGAIDLECIRPNVSTNFELVVVSSGSYRGQIPHSNPQDNSEIGTLKHDCWTYWGHSGAPLIDAATNTLSGLHSSWDDQTGMRHGVPLAAIKQFMSETERTRGKGQE